MVIDTDGSAFITKAEFDSLKNNFQAQIDNYNTSIDSKIDGAIAAYLAGIKTASMFDVNSKYHDKGGSGLKWLIFGSQSSAPENANTIAYAQIFLINAENGFNGKYGGGVYYGYTPDNSYPFFATSTGGWDGARMRHTINKNYTGTWPARFMVDGSYADNTSNDKLLGKKLYVIRYLSYNDRGRDNFTSDTFKAEPWDLDDTHYPLRGAWQYSPSVQTQCLSGTWVGVETIEDINWGQCYMADYQTSRNILCTASLDTNVWQKGSVAWPSLTQAFNSGSTHTASYAVWNHTSNMLTMYYKTKNILDLCSNAEDVGVKLFEGANLCDAPANGVINLDIKNLSIGTLVAGTTPTAGIVRVAFNTEKFSNSSSLTGDILITHKNGTQLASPVSYIDLNKTTDTNVSLTLSNVKKGAVWVKCRPMKNSTTNITTYGEYACLDFDNIKLETES